MASTGPSASAGVVCVVDGAVDEGGDANTRQCEKPPA